MELEEVIRTTFACREFTDDPVTDETLYRILELARFAPSGGNRQGAHVIVVRDRDIRQTLGGDYVIYDHPDIDIVIMPKMKKIVAFPKDKISDLTYDTESRLFDYLTKKGIHIIDNRNTSNPINIAFIVLPGNYDIATKGDYLYADSYLDLVVFDISNINSIVEVNRLENNFENYYINQGLYDDTQGVIVGYNEEVKEEFIENHNCGLAYD